ncbi:hypothetical protein [Bacteroides acidifaciens]|uniref:hypothetical protein n=1 Tax=Bacteroides acidifaciens TaxID=85831 RepID=UPI0030158007
MKKTVLVRDYGLSESYLMRIFRTKGNGISWKISPKKNSAILFDTEGLAKWMAAGK